MAARKVTAFAWYRREDYQRVREISNGQMPATFEEFEIKEGKLLASLEAQDITCEKTIIDPEELLAFTNKFHAGRVDSNIRGEFAAVLFRKKHAPDD
jgi:hypothetical protein